MAIDRDDSRVKEIRAALQQGGAWPEQKPALHSNLYYSFTMYLAESLGKREIMLATMDSSEDTSAYTASARSVFFMDGLIALCKVGLSELHRNTDGKIRLSEGIRFVPWASIKSVTRVPSAREDGELLDYIDFDVELPAETITVRHAQHRDRDKAAVLYSELIEALANR